MLKIFNKKRKLEKMKICLNNLINNDLVLLENGHFVNKNNKLEIIYVKIHNLLKNRELEQLPDNILIDLLKQIDEAFVSIKDKELSSSKVDYIKEIANKIKKIVPIKLSMLVYKSKLLIERSNDLIKQDALDKIDYVDVYNTILTLEYYLQEVLYEKRLQKLVLELKFIFNKKTQYKIMEGKTHEKTRLSI